MTDADAFDEWLQTVSRLASMLPGLDVDRHRIVREVCAGHGKAATAPLLHLDSYYGTLAARLLVADTHEVTAEDPLPA